jgi:hypothetical protein
MFVVVDTKTRCAVEHPRTRTRFYHTLPAARAAATRLQKLAVDRYLAGEGSERPVYTAMDTRSYEAQVPMHEVTNLMTGKLVQERADTPWHCSVASEAYWSG